MKILPVFVLAVSLFFASNIDAQTKTKPKPAAKMVKTTPTTSSTIALKNQTDSASYALGMNIAKSMNEDIGDLNTNLIVQGLQDVFNKKALLFDETVAHAVLNKYSVRAQEEKCKPVIDAGLAFLQKNKTKAGVITTTSGLQYEIIKQGTGIKPSAIDTVIVHYRGSLIDGTQFDASYDRNEPLTLVLNQVIKGWTEGVQLMNKDSKYKFYIPYELGYGLKGAGATIPGGSVLIFEVELLDVRPTLPK